MKVGRTHSARINVGSTAAIAGFTIPAASNLIIPIWEMPTTSAPAAQVERYFIQHHEALRAVVAMDVVGVTLWMVFGGAVWLRMRRAAGGDTLSTSLFGVAFAAMATLLMVGFTVFLVLAYRVTDASTARALYDVSFGLLAMSGMPAIVALCSYAATAYGNSHLPRRTADLAAITAAAHALLLVSLVTPRGVFSLEGPLITAVPALLFAWILSTGLTLRRPDWTSPSK